MANFDSSLYTDQAAKKQQPDGWGGHGAVVAQSASVATTTGTATNDLLRFLYVPKGAVVIAVQLTSTDCDSGSALLYDVGDSGSTTRYFSSSTLGQAGGNAWAATGIGNAYTSETLIYGTIHTQGNSAVAGTVTLTVFYTMGAGFAS